MGRTKKQYRRPNIIRKRETPAVILTREEWGAQPPSFREPFQLPAFHIMIKLFTDTPGCSTREECSAAMRDLQEKYMGMGLPDIPYNFCIGGDETIYEGRGWFTKSDKLPEDNYSHWNGLSLDVAYIGQREQDKEMTSAIVDLLSHAIRKRTMVGMFNFRVLSGMEEGPLFPTASPEVIHDPLNDPVDDDKIYDFIEKNKERPLQPLAPNKHYYVPSKDGFKISGQ